MNSSSYKVISLVAVGEHVAANGKGAGGAATRTRQAPPNTGADGSQGGVVSAWCRALVGVGLMGLMGIASLYMGAAHAQLASNSLPTSGVVSSGTATISTSGNTMGNTMLITQGSDRASINWGSFNVGSAASVNIVQPGSNSVLLNRVVGNDPSQIMGSITANGQVMLVNPNGVVFGKGGSVTATSFTASTLGISDADFQAGNYRFGRSGSTAGVRNQGTITATGGYVALLGASVSNEGKIVTKGGDVVMAAGESATIGIPVSRGGKVRLVMTAADINTAVANTVDGIVQTEGGQVLMQAASVGDAIASIRHSGQIDTTGAQGGDVTLRADHGNITVSGSINANNTDAANKAGGTIMIGRVDDANGKPVLAAHTDVTGAVLESKGGFIETSGSTLNFENVGKVSAKEWLLDPTDVVINAAAASTIATTLGGGTSMTILTDGSTPGTTGDGNISIDSAITANNTTANDATLTLIADNRIQQSSTINLGGSGSGLINLVMRANGNSQTAGNNGGVILTNLITASGSVTLDGTNSGTQGGLSRFGVRTSGITAKSITISGITSAAGSSGDGTRIEGNLTATGGDIDIYGESRTQYGVAITGGTFSATAGNIKIAGLTASAGAGVYVVNTVRDSTFNTQNLAIGDSSLTTAKVITGVLRNNVGLDRNNTVTTSGSTGTTIVGSAPQGATVNGVSITNLTTNGALTLTGTSSQTDSSGLVISGTVAAQSINIKGYGTGTTQSGIGAQISGSLTATGGDITVYGESVRQHGVQMNGSYSATGDVNIQGLTTTAGASSMYGVALVNATINAATVNIKNDAVGAATAFTAVTGTLRNNVSINGGSFTTTGAEGVTVTGSVKGGGAGTGVALQGTISGNGALSITGTATDTGSSGVSLSSGSVLTTSGKNSHVSLSGNISNANSFANAININGNVQGVNGAAVTVTGSTSGRGSAVFTSPDTAGSATATGNRGDIGGLTAGAVTINGTITNASSTASAVSLRGITTSANTISITGTTTGSGSGVALLSDTAWAATETSWTKTWNDSTWTAAGLAGTNTITINGTTTGASGTGVLISGQNVTNTNGNTLVTGRGTGGGVSLARTSYTSGSTSGTNSAVLSANVLGSQSVTVTGNLTGNLAGAGVVFGSGSGTDSSLLTVQGSTTAAINTAVNYGVLLRGSFRTTQNSTITGTSTSNVIGLGAGVQFNGANSITTTGGTALTVRGTSTNNLGVEVSQSATVSSGTGDAGMLALDGTTLYNGSSGNNGTAGVKVFGTLATKNISVTGLGYASGGNATSLGIVIGGGTLGSQTATDTITLNGTSNNNNAGSYAFAGTVQAKGNISITGVNVGAAGSADSVAINGSSKVISAAGSVSITGTTPEQTGSIYVGNGSSITAASSAGVTLLANGGSINFDGGTITNGTSGSTGNGTGGIGIRLANNSASSSSTVNFGNASIMQYGNGGITIENDYGDIAVKTIANSGTGNVVLAAGTRVAAGVGTGGNVVLASGGTLSNNGGLYIYTGSYSSFGSIASQWNGLTKTGSGFGTLYYNGSSNPRNVGFNSAWSSTNTALMNGDTNQVVFRENKTPAAFSITLGNTQATYGAEAYPTSQTAELVRLKNTYTGSSTLTQTDGANTFSLASAEVLAGLGATRTLGSQSASGYENANTGGYAYSASIDSGLGLNTTISNSASLVHVINKANATVTANSASAIYNGTTQSVTGFTASGLVAGEDASVLTGVSAIGTGKNAGTWVSTASGSDNNYNLTFQSGNLVIGKANATVTANSASVAYNGSTQSVTGFTASGLVGGEDASVLTGVRVAGAGRYEGTYTTSASGSDGNYNLAFVDGSLTISIVPPPATPTATPDADAITSLCTQTFGGSNVGETQTPSMAGVVVGGGGKAANYRITLVTGNNGVTTTRTIAGDANRNSQSTKLSRCQS